MPATPAEHAIAQPIEQRERELEILTSVATALNRSASLSAALETSLSQVAELLHLSTGWVWLLDEATGRPYLAASQNLPAALRDHPERMQGRCYCLSSLQKGELDGAANVLTCSRLEWLTDETAGLRFHASVPLHARGERVGVMNVASTEWRELAPEELRLLHVVGDLLGLGIERSRLYERCAVTGAAEERNRLAREIHDTLAQGLAATALQLETADALLEAGADADRVRSAVRRALESTRQNLEDARRSVLDLRPRPLQGRSLAGALAELCEQRDAEGVPRVVFQLRGDDRPLPSSVEAGLYRVAQEALANALRHAGAGTITVGLSVERERATLQVEDDGRGFGVSACDEGVEPERVEGFGLVGMCERARLLGGAFDVQSSPGEGTRVQVAVPLE
jgi:two-component system, NarL family, sensor kinase